MTPIRLLCIVNRNDLVETELFIGLWQKGVALDVICNPSGPNFKQLEASGVPVLPRRFTGRFDPAGIRFIRAQLSAKPYDAIYAFNNKTLSNALFAARRIPVKIVCYRGTVGNISYLSPGSWTTFLHPRIDRIVCVSEAVRQYFLEKKCLWWRFQPEQLVTIHKGHNPDWYEQPPHDLSEFGIPPDAFVVGCIGRSRPHKGVKYLIDAARWLPTEAPIHFVLIGDLEADKKLHRQIAASPFKDRIHLTGFRRDARAITAACHVYVMPATAREGLSRATIEAMSRGVPAIVTDAGGNSEIVEDGKSGRVVPARDGRAIARAIEMFYRDPEKRSAMGQGARQRIINDFNIRHTIEKTYQMLDALVKDTSDH